MVDGKCKLIIFLFAGILLLLPLFGIEQSDSSTPERALVIAVYDGDTIKVRFASGCERKVRLIGIDSSEIEDPREEVKFQALMSKRFTFSHLYRRIIGLTYDWEKEDKYKRVLAYVWTEKEGLFNKFILEEGFARVFRKFSFKYMKVFIEAERKAREFNKGLWQKKPYPSISPADTKKHIDQVLSVEFLCSKVRIRGKYCFLCSPGDEFFALVEQKNPLFLKDLRSYEGNTICVEGLIEEYKGRPQIMVFFPSQIQQK